MKRDVAEEQAQIVKPEEVLARIEGDYFCDYAVFSGTLREYIVRALEAQCKSEPNELHKRANTGDALRLEVLSGGPQGS